MYHGKQLKIHRDGVEYGHWYYFYWWNWLPKELRYFGREDTYYEGPHRTFGLWFTNISWRSPWTSWKH